MTTFTRWALVRSGYSARAEARSSSWSSSSCQSRSARASHTTPSAGWRPSAMGPAIDTTARSQLSTARDRKRVTGKPPGSASTLSTSRPRAWAATACAASCLAVCSVRSIPGLYHRRLRGVKTRGAAIRGVLLFWRLRQEVVLYPMSFLPLDTSYWVPHVRRRNLAFHHGFRAEQGRYVGVVRNELSPTPSAFCLGNWLDRLLIVGQRQLERCWPSMWRTTTSIGPTVGWVRRPAWFRPAACSACATDQPAGGAS